MKASTNSPKIYRTLRAVLILIASAQVVTALDIAVSLKGKVVDLQGKAAVGARLDLVETPLTTLSGSDGSFHLSGTFQVGLLRRAALAGGAGLEFHRGRLILPNPGSQPLTAMLLTTNGRSRRIEMPGGSGDFAMESGLGLGPEAGLWYVRLGQGGSERTWRLVRPSHGAPLQLWSLQGSDHPATGFRKAGA